MRRTERSGASKPRRTPWQKLRDAADAGRGLRLTADEVWMLGGQDDAIRTRATLDDFPEEEDEDRYHGRRGS